MPLSPRNGFDWLLVQWGAPDQRRSQTCCYCEAPMGNDEIPLTLWNDMGWAAEFCEACQRKYWGIGYLEQ